MKICELEIGSKGTEVTVLQASLRFLQITGKDKKPIELDGEFGTNTQYGVNEFQKRQKAYGCSCCNSGCSEEGVFTVHCWNRLLGVSENA